VQLMGLDAAFWVLSTYYAAQFAIVRGCLNLSRLGHTKPNGRAKT
jgi:hypothetical protein